MTATGRDRAEYPVGAAATVAELERDPHLLLARLRAAEPVSWLPALGGWLVTRYDLAAAVMRDAATYTVDDPRFSTAQVIGPSMLSLDGAEHTRHRDPFARPFRPAPTRDRFTGFVTAEVERRLTALRPAGEAELRAGFAGPLAVAVVAEALGLADAEAATIRSWYESFVAAISAITAGGNPAGTSPAPPVPPAPAAPGTRSPGLDVPAAVPAGPAAGAYALLRASVAAALAGNDDTALLVRVARGAGPPGRTGRGERAARTGPAGLSSDEVVANAAVLMFGGIDTTEGMITNAVLHLLGSGPAGSDLAGSDLGGSDLAARVRADRSLLPAVIEESVRLEPAAAVVDRYATRDVTLGGAAVRAGDLVRVSIAGANRDPAVFAGPDRFDPARENAGAHLSFARGPHFCFGAHLARLETRAALDGLLDLLPGLRLDAERPAAPRGLVFRKPPELHVRWAP